MVRTERSEREPQLQDNSTLTEGTFVRPRLPSLGLSYYTPNINVARDPRWGRIEETPGECPLLNGAYAVAFTEGFQGNGSILKASVTAKHFIAYNLEVDTESTPPSDWCGSALNEGGNCTAPNDRHSFNATGFF